MTSWLMVQQGAQLFQKYQPLKKLLLYYYETCAIYMLLPKMCSCDQQGPREVSQPIRSQYIWGRQYVDISSVTVHTSTHSSQCNKCPILY